MTQEVQLSLDDSSLLFSFFFTLSKQSEVKFISSRRCLKKNKRYFFGLLLVPHKDVATASRISDFRGRFCFIIFLIF